MTTRLVPTMLAPDSDIGLLITRKYQLKHYNAAFLTLRHLRDSIEKWAISQDSP